MMGVVTDDDADETGTKTEESSTDSMMIQYYSHKWSIRPKANATKLSKNVPCILKMFSWKNEVFPCYCQSLKISKYTISIVYYIATTKILSIVTRKMLHCEEKINKTEVRRQFTSPPSHLESQLGATEVELGLI
jgi:hypothetical protein